MARFLLNVIIISTLATPSFGSGIQEPLKLPPVTVQMSHQERLDFYSKYRIVKNTDPKTKDNYPYLDSLGKPIMLNDSYVMAFPHSKKHLEDAKIWLGGALGLASAGGSFLGYGLGDMIFAQTPQQKDTATVSLVVGGVLAASAFPIIFPYDDEIKKAITSYDVELRAYLGFFPTDDLDEEKKEGAGSAELTPRLTPLETQSLQPTSAPESISNSTGGLSFSSRSKLSGLLDQRAFRNKEGLNSIQLLVEHLGNPEKKYFYEKYSLSWAILPSLGNTFSGLGSWFQGDYLGGLVCSGSMIGGLLLYGNDIIDTQSFPSKSGTFLMTAGLISGWIIPFLFENDNNRNLGLALEYHPE